MESAGASSLKKDRRHRDWVVNIRIVSHASGLGLRQPASAFGRQPCCREAPGSFVNLFRPRTGFPSAVPVALLRSRLHWESRSRRPQSRATAPQQDRPPRHRPTDLFWEAPAGTTRRDSGETSRSDKFQPCGFLPCALPIPGQTAQTHRTTCYSCAIQAEQDPAYGIGPTAGLLTLGAGSQGPFFRTGDCADHLSTTCSRRSRRRRFWRWSRFRDH